MKNIAIIPARSGSKGLPDKNIKELNGKPLMAYSIDSAIRSRCFDTIMVSTDSEKYAEIARNYGADAPFLRSKQTSSDYASSSDAILEVIKMYEKMGEIFDTFCLLQPTSPMRTAEDIKDAYRLYAERDAFAVVSMTEVDHPLSWCGIVGADGSLDGFISESDNKQRQLQANYYRPNGAIYIASISEYRKNQFLYREGTYAYIMPRKRSIDIDSDFDFKLAEFLMRDK